MYTILLYYKYTHIENPEKFMEEQRKLCNDLKLKGRILVAHEGINGTVEGTTENTQKYIEEMNKDPRFADIHWKKSEGTGSAFPKLMIKVRSEIVSGHLDELDINPTQVTGKYITPEQLHAWLHPKKGEQAKEFYIIDMRNDYEFSVGYFENSLFPGLTQFRDLKKILPHIEHLKGKTIVTVCTGGVRCEKASGFLVQSGFADVYQLQGGIVSYMEQYPNLDFKGKLYVFDQRLVMGFNTTDSSHEIVGRCAQCQKPSEHFINCVDDDCHRHFICCEACLEGKRAILCPMGCRVGARHILK